MPEHHQHSCTLTEIKQLIPQGESHTLEFKKSLTQLKPAMETLCGFLNAKGGIVIIGANQQGKLVGNEVTDSTRQEIAREIQKIDPLPEVTVDYFALDDKTDHFIVTLFVPTGNTKPYVYDGRPFYRNQSSTMRMPQNRYSQMLKEANASPYDTWEMKLVPDVSIQDLNQEAIKRTVQIAVEHKLLPTEALQDSTESILSQLELIRNHQLTNAAMVLFAADRSAGFSQCCIKMARFRGNDELTGFIDNQIVTGNAFQLMREASIFIQRHLSVASFFDESQFERIDKPALPVLAIREALCNAICHRDYSTFTASIYLAIYDNRLEVWNNGLLTTDLTFDDLKKRHTSHPRNKHIAQVFYLRRYIESWGTGTTRMIALCQDQGLPDPQFSEYSNGFSVTFFYKKSGQSKLPPTSVSMERLNARRQEMITLLEKHGPISIHTLMEQLTNPPSERMVRKDLVALRKAGYICLIGYGRSALWETSSSAAPEPEATRNNEEQRGTTRNNEEPQKATRKTLMSISVRPRPFLDSTASPAPSHALNLGDYKNIVHFLSIYEGNRATFEAYRRELERLLQWGWLIAKKSILTLTREDIEAYIQFCMKPPKSWIAKKHVPRYVEKAGQRIPNSQWRPFVVKINKSEYKEGKMSSTSSYQMSPSSLRALFAILGSFYDHLLREEKIARNPITLIRQKSRYLQKQQQTTQIIRLSDKQWQACLQAAKSMENTQGNVHQRTLFIITAMYLLYLRISEFAASERWTPLMNHFYQDSHEQWWFKTLGKGNKLRTIAVSDDMLTALIHYRKKLGLSPLPSPTDDSPLIPKVKGQGPMESTRHIRRLIQDCFDQAIIRLREKNLTEEADTLETATVHWLRHTGISDDVNKRGRPMMHVRDDAGHASVVTTEKYSDVETQDRYKSAKKKTVNVKADNRNSTKEK